MRVRRAFALLASTLMVLLGFSFSASAIELRLEVVAPVSGSGTPTQFSSGYPIILRASSMGELGIATNSTPLLFPKDSRTGYLVYDDPDGCLILDNEFIFDVADPLCAGPPASDETFVAFTPEADLPGVPDLFGDSDLRALLVDSAGMNPAYVNQDGMVEMVGPGTGMDVEDGIGYGASDDFASLVIISETGPGLVLDQNFNPPAVKTVRNLAGFIGQVSYELNDRTNRTSINAAMMVPFGLIAPTVVTDECVGPVATCTPQWRIDGGPVQPVPNNDNVRQKAYPDLVDASTFRLLAFLVSGNAPSIITDESGNGRISTTDVRLMGYELVSNAVVIRFRQLHGNVCSVGTNNVIFNDFDGNGVSMSGIVCPAGPGQLTGVPR